MKISITNEFYLEHHEKVHKIVRSFIKVPHQRNDVEQEIWSQILKGITSFEGRSTVSTWIYRVAHNVSKNFLDKEKRRSHAGLSSIPLYLMETKNSADSPSGRAETRALYTEIVFAFKRLTPNDRAVLVLSGMGGRSYENTGKILGIPTKIVRSRLRRARVKLRQHTEPIRNP